MADVAVALRTILIANGPLAAKVATRVFPVNRPQDSLLPAIRYSVISDITGEHLQGSDDVSSARIQFDVFSKRYSEAREVAGLLMKALPPATTSEGIRIGRVRWEGPFDDGDDTPQGYIHRARVDLLVEYTVQAAGP